MKTKTKTKERKDLPPKGSDIGELMLIEYRIDWAIKDAEDRFDRLRSLKNSLTEVRKNLQRCLKEHQP